MSSWKKSSPILYSIPEKNILVSADIAETVLIKQGPKKLSSVTQTKESRGILEQIERSRDRIGKHLAELEESQTPDLDCDSIFGDYFDALKLHFPDIVCSQIICGQSEDSEFSIGLGNQHLEDFLLTILERKDGTRYISLTSCEFLQSKSEDIRINERELAGIFDAIGGVSIAFKRLDPFFSNRENGDVLQLEFEFQIPLSSAYLLREILYGIGIFLHEHGFPIIGPVEICKSFSNRSGFLQAIASEAIEKPDIRPNKQ